MKLVDSQLNKAYETLRDTTSRVRYDAKLPPQRRVLNPVTPQYTWNGFDGAWGLPSSSNRQPAGYYHHGQRPTTDDYWGGTQVRAGFDGAWGMPSSVPWQPAGYYHTQQRPTANDYWGDPRAWNERSTDDFRDPREKQGGERDQGWDFNNWHETEPSESGSFSWTENEELWRQADEERRKAEKEREERADAERRRKRKAKRAERDEEQKRINDARIPAQQKKLSGKIIALDEEIARLSRRSALASGTEDGCRTGEEGTDTVDHFAIKLNRCRRVLGEALNIHHRLCRAQRSNGQADEAEDAERKLAKAREDSAFRLADEFAREEEEQSAGRASLHDERLRMQQQRHHADHEKEPELQEQDDWNNAASGNREPNGSRATAEHSDVEETWPGERNVCGLSSKVQEQADIGANPVPMQLRYRRIYDWLGQLVDEEEGNEASGGHTVKNTKHLDSPIRPTQASRYLVDNNSGTPISNQNPRSTLSQSSHNIVDSKPEPLIPDLSQCSSPSQASLHSVNGGPDPPIPPPNQNCSFPLNCHSPIDPKPGALSPGQRSDRLESDNETFISEYLQTVHKPHLEVHGEFWDFVAEDEVNCDFCRLVSPVLQCPKCNLRACSECKTHRGERSYDNLWEWR